MRNVLIFGSGRSGTSMLTGALAQAGYYLGNYPNYLGKNGANPKGFFEDLEVNTINEDILKKSLLNPPEGIRRFIFPELTFYRARWLARIPISVSFRSDLSIDQRIKKQLSNTPFCYKDPRFSYTLPVWQKHLTSNTIFLVVYREPSKTAESIVRECRENPALKTLKMNTKLALQVWKFMYSHILRNYSKSVNKNHWIFIHYEQLFDPVRIREIEAILDAKIDLGFPDRTISRSENINRDVSSKIENLYLQLNRLSSFQ